jgi:hypothetical protein
MTEINFLIGRGELLTYDITGPKRGGKKAEAYTLEQARERLQPQFKRVVRDLDELPKEACPRDYGVARLTLNPGYIARSYFPTALLRATGLESVGSRTVSITPERWTRKMPPTETTTTELFVAGKRDRFRQLSQSLAGAVPESLEALDFARIERFSALSAEDRIRDYGSRRERFFEVGLHLLPDEESSFIREAFAKFAGQREMTIYAGLGCEAGNLWFVPVEGPRSAIEGLAQFAFVRVIRPMPRLRGLHPTSRRGGAPLRCKLPEEAPLSADPKVAILDGGLPNQHVIGPWLRSYKILDPAAADADHGPEHGLGVTSAFLFGPIEPGSTAARPFSWVDHLRVFDDEASLEDPLELYRAIGFVEQVLLSRQYEFVNLSLGPDLPIEDTDVHAWTSVIDDLLSDGDTFMTVAVGNNGELDRPSGNARVQVPADCVNAIAVGAADRTGSRWLRAPYSAFGPGRMPGVVKPDLVVFGGHDPDPFHVVAPGSKPLLTALHGTSFAAPYLLRSAVGIRALLGDELSPLALKALLVHAAEPGRHDKLEVGWGRVPDDILRIISCPAGVARVVYQGELKPGKFLRAALPIPKGGLTGRIRLRATFCYASPVDPQDAACYTRAGLEIMFRPDEDRIREDQEHAATKGFFDMKKYLTEGERRSDTGKWETVLHGEKGFLGSSLNNPVFDIHYNAREAGATTHRATKIRYALVITVEAPRHADLYNEILRSYATILTPIAPRVPLPIRV